MMAHEREEARGGDGALMLHLGEHGKGEGVNGGRGQTVSKRERALGMCGAFSVASMGTTSTRSSHVVPCS
jgi:hypothetical protein